VDIKELEEGVIKWNHIEVEEIEIFIKNTEIKSIGILMGMIIERDLPIIRQEKIIIIRKSFTLKN
jgi:hypothetical protein